jgi:drug/metabolite transporter (DMT)-like permease
MSWYLSALLSVIGNSIGISCLKKLQDSYPIEVYLFYIWFLSSIFLAFPSFPIDFKQFGPFIVLFIILAGFFSWLGNYSYNVSVKLQSNLGYVEALSSIRIGISYLAAIIFFDGQFKLIKLVAILGLVFGVFLVTNKSGSKENSRKQWAVWGALSGIFFAGLAISTKITFIKGVNPAITTCLFFLVASFLFLGTSIKRRSLTLPNKKPILLILASIFTAVGNFALFYSYKYAPNLAYPIAISNSRVIILYLVSIVLGSEKFELKRGIGILIAFASAFMLS